MVALIHVHKGFNTLSFKGQSLILCPLRVCQILHSSLVLLAPREFRGHAVRRHLPAWKMLQPPANSCVSSPFQKCTLQPQSSLQMSSSSWLPGWNLAQERSWARITQLSHSQIPDPQKTWEHFSYGLRLGSRFTFIPYLYKIL